MRYKVKGNLMLKLLTLLKNLDNYGSLSGQSLFNPDNLEFIQY